MSNNFEIDKYLSDIYSDELVPDWCGEEISWIDELGVFQTFQNSVREVRNRLAENGDVYTVEQVERALRAWLEGTVSSLVADAADRVLRGPDNSLFYSTLRKEDSVRGKGVHISGDVYTGRAVFNPEVLREMILFYASKPFGVLKTKLNKLLWYSDFLHYRLHGVSISGATYVHLPFGPVPDQYEKHLSALVEDQALGIETKEIGDFHGANLKARRAPLMNQLPGSAVAVLESVFRRLGRASSTEISKLSHEEAGYQNTRPGERISYEYADKLKLKTGEGSISLKI